MDLRVPKQVVDAALVALSDESLAEGERRKQDGMATALAHCGEWTERARAAVLAEMRTPQAANLTFMGEDLVQMVYASGGGLPKPNGVGGFVSGLLHADLIELTGERRKLRAPRSHGRKSDVYRYRLSRSPSAQPSADAGVVSANDPLSDLAA